MAKKVERKMQTSCSLRPRVPQRKKKTVCNGNFGGFLFSRGVYNIDFLLLDVFKFMILHKKMRAPQLLTEEEPAENPPSVCVFFPGLRLRRQFIIIIFFSVIAQTQLKSWCLILSADQGRARRLADCGTSNYVY